MRIPAPARATAATSETFASALDRVDAIAAAPRIEAPPAAEQTPREEPASVEDHAAEDPPEPVEAPRGDTAAIDPHAAAAAPVDPQAVAEPSVTTTLRRGEPARQEAAGKGTDSPRTSSPTEDLLAAIVQRGTEATTATAAIAPANGPTAAVARPGEAPVRGVDAASSAKAAPTRSAPVVAGYRANAKVSAELVDQARDSVFKQILMRVFDGGGEMRVRLEPPDLGELDLHMKVENGNQLSLWIGAERSDVATMLQRNLDGLRDTLQAAGLDVADAQVGTRDGGNARGQQGGDGSANDEHPARDDGAMQRRGGWITADGLDFWA